MPQIVAAFGNHSGILVSNTRRSFCGEVMVSSWSVRQMLLAICGAGVAMLPFGSVQGVLGVAVHFGD